MERFEIAGTRIMELPVSGPAVGTEQDALDLIGLVFEDDTSLIAIPVGRLAPDFLRLQSGMAGAFFQKMQNYRLRVAIIGDLSAAIAKSSALRDFVYESNKIGQMPFVESGDALAERLATQGA